ncbi:MAG: M28 family peptidase [Nitrospiria bacterium]
MILGLTVFHWKALTEHRAKTLPDHPDPTLRTRRYRLPYENVFQLVVQTLEALPQWTPVHQDPQAGAIRAERHTRIFRFIDDVHIIIIATKKGNHDIVLNLESTSRVGKGDLGQNARNIREFLNEMDRAAAASVFDRQAAAGAFEGLPDRLADHVHRLAGQIGERHYKQKEAYDRAATYIAEQFLQSGYRPSFETFRIDEIPLLARLRSGGDAREAIEALAYKNIVAVKAGLGDAAIVVGAHYDTHEGTPGADDNASGIAVLLETARLLQARHLEKTVFFVAFGNEEAPFFRTSAMGSAHFLKARKAEHTRIAFMISLEMLGYYTDVPKSQAYPPLLRFFYPDRGNFIAVVGNLASNRFARKIKQSFEEKAGLPAEALSAPRWVPGVDFSDQLHFWKAGIPAVMVTDTAFYRNPYYHTAKDLPQTLNFNKMAEVTKGIVFALLRIDKETG